MPEFENNQEQQDAALRMRALRPGSTGYVLRGDLTIDAPGVWSVVGVENDRVILMSADGSTKRPSVEAYVAFQRDQEALHNKEKLLPAGDAEASIDTAPRSALVDAINEQAEPSPEAAEILHVDASGDMGERALDAVGIETPDAKQPEQTVQAPENAEAEQAKGEALEQIKSLVGEYDQAVDVFVNQLNATWSGMRGYVDGFGSLFSHYEGGLRHMVSSIALQITNPAELAHASESMNRLVLKRKDSLEGLQGIMDQLRYSLDEVRAHLGKLSADVAAELQQDTSWSDVVTEANFRYAKVSQGIDELSNLLDTTQRTLERNGEDIETGVRLMNDRASSLMASSPREIHTDNYDIAALKQLVDQSEVVVNDDFVAMNRLVNVGQFKVMN